MTTREQAEEARNIYIEAEEEYRRKMKILYPVGSAWNCVHGSKEGRRVRVLTHPENGVNPGWVTIVYIDSGARKSVFFTTLIETR